MSSFVEKVENIISSDREVFVIAFRNVVNIYNAEGNVLQSYVISDINEQTFCILDDFFMVAAANSHPNVIILPFTPTVHAGKKKATTPESSALEFPAPGKPRVLTVSKCSKFCAFAVDKTLYLYQLNGQFRFSRDLRTKITCMKFDLESRHIIAGTKCGIVKFVSVFSYREGDLFKAVNDHDFTYLHGGEVVDIFVEDVAIEHDIISFDNLGEIMVIKNCTVIARITLYFFISCVITDCFQQALCFGTETGEVGKLHIRAANTCPYRLREGPNMVANAHKSVVLGLRLSPSNNDFASCGDKRIIIWSLAPLNPKRTIDLAECPLCFYWIEEPKPLIDKKFVPPFSVKKFDEIDVWEKTFKFTPNNVSLPPEAYSFTHSVKLAE